MMKKKFIYSLPVLVALAFNGCGSSSTNEVIDDTIDSAVTEYEKLVSTGYSVVVERGAVLDANVTDANGSVAVQVSDTNNTYIFENEPVYPVTAEGGWIDVDGDGNLTDTDVALDINLTSYSDVVTPTTTYCSDENETIRQERLQELASETNCTAEELLTVPSEATRNSIIVLNAVYEKLMEKGNTHSNAPIAISAILERYAEIDNNANLDENASSEEMALALEEQTMFNLKAKGLIKKLDLDDIEDFKAKKPKKLKNEDDSDEDSTEEDDSGEENDSSEEDNYSNGKNDNSGKGKGITTDDEEDSSEEDDNSTDIEENSSSENNSTSKNDNSRKGKGTTSDDADDSSEEGDDEDSNSKNDNSGKEKGTTSDDADDSSEEGDDEDSNSKNDNSGKKEKSKSNKPSK